MKQFAIVTAAFLAGCDLVDHFTEEPDRGKKIVIDCRGVLTPMETQPDTLPPIGQEPDTNLTCTGE